MLLDLYHLVTVAFFMESKLDKTHSINGVLRSITVK